MKSFGLLLIAAASGLAWYVYKQPATAAASSTGTAASIPSTSTPTTTTGNSAANLASILGDPKKASAKPLKINDRPTHKAQPAKKP